MKTTLELLCGHLGPRGVRFLLIGGYALPAYGVVRQTMDTDCLICDADESECRAALKSLGYVENQRTEAFVRYVHPLAATMDLDVMLVDLETFDRMFNSSLVWPAGEALARVPALPHLIALKLHAVRNCPARELRDLADVVELLRQNPDAMTEENLRSACEQYGPSGCYEKIRGHL